MLKELMDLQGKHIFTETFGDGEIEDITKQSHDAKEGYFVYFHSNREGQIKLGGQEFLDDIDEVREIPK